MNITMISTQDGSEDGFTIRTYEKDVDYSLGSTIGQIALATAFVNAGMAVEQVAVAVVEVEGDDGDGADPVDPAGDTSEAVDYDTPATPRKKKAAAAPAAE